MVPPFRFRHSSVLVEPEPGKLLHKRIAAALGYQASTALCGQQQGWESQGHLLLVHGGYNTRGEEFGGSEIEVRPAWSKLDLTPPTMAAHHLGFCYQQVASWWLPALLRMPARAWAISEIATQGFRRG